ncbi:MAG TPA: cytochrome c [Chitinophagaceae bacterium]|nr:cytochrome c [Chitinophagaceae bacterium]
MNRPAVIWLLLCTAFLCFSLSLYLKPYFDSSSRMNNEAMQGHLVWQQHNCQSCHQLYGLGGYLGPDLTNVFSKRGEVVIKAILEQGTKQMPAFRLSKQEYSQLILFLKAVDQSGDADPRHFSIYKTGMIKSNEFAGK